jgi:putative NIF3 family GTP cyclohydrolase 1 type 2
MPKVKLATIASHCDEILRTGEIGDYEGALNGLQVANSGSITKIAAAVDASKSTIKLAAAAGANLLIVHHGLFWGAAPAVDGEKLRTARVVG